MYLERYRGPVDAEDQISNTEKCIETAVWSSDESVTPGHQTRLVEK